METRTTPRRSRSAARSRSNGSAAAAAQRQLQLQQAATAGPVEREGRVAETPLGPEVDPALSHFSSVRAHAQVQEALGLCVGGGLGGEREGEQGLLWQVDAVACGGEQGLPLHTAGLDRGDRRGCSLGCHLEQSLGPVGRSFSRAGRRGNDDRKKEDKGYAFPERRHHGILREAPR
jgi:hypothetical protein